MRICNLKGSTHQLFQCSHIGSFHLWTKCVVVSTSFLHLPILYCRLVHASEYCTRLSLWLLTASTESQLRVTFSKESSLLLLLFCFRLLARQLKTSNPNGIFLKGKFHRESKVLHVSHDLTVTMLQMLYCTIFVHRNLLTFFLHPTNS